MAKQIPKGKEVLYAYISSANRKYLSKLEKQTNQTTSYVVDQMLTAMRKDEDIVLETRIPAYVKRAEEFKRRQKAK